MRFEKLTIKAQEVFQAAQELATNLQHSTIDVEHLVVAMLQQDGGVTKPILQKMGIEPSLIESELVDELNRQAKVGGASSYGSSISGRLQSLFNVAFKEADKLGDEYVSTEHFLIAATEDSGLSGRTLKSHGVNKKDVLTAIESIRSGRKVTDQNAEDKYQALDKFGIDLTEKARENKLDPVIGRDEEIRRVIQVLSRRTKNNPVLIGEPGVGKTAIAEGLAQRIVSGDIQ